MKPTEHAPLKPLLRLTPLQPGESLPSLLTRLTILNHYATPTILQRLSRSEWPDTSECPSRSSTLHNLAQLTCIDVLDLYTASDLVMVSAQAWANSSPWYPPDLTQPIPYWNWLPVSGMVHAAQSSRFCPQCLMDGAYHHLIWRVVPIAICLIHKCLLIDKCPHCSASVSIRDIVLTRCYRCRFDLRQAPTSSVLNETWGHIAQGTLWTWLRGQSRADENLRWPNQPPPFLWNMAEGLARMLLCFSDRFPSHELAPSSPRKVHSSTYTLKGLCSSEIFWAYSHALKFMTDWPQGFREFLHYCAPKRDIDLEKGAGFLYSSWLCKRWKNNNFKFIQEAFDTFRLDRTLFPTVEYGGEPFERAFAYATLNETAQILQIPEYSIQRLRQIGLVRTVGTTTGMFCLRSDLHELKRHWSELLSVEEGAIWLGVTPDIVVGLSREHVLKSESNHESIPGKTLLFSKNIIAKLLDKVNFLAGDFTDLQDLVSLTDAAKQLYCVHMTEAKLLKRVASRSLSARRSFSQKDDWGIREISFTQRDIDKVLKEIAVSKEWVSADDASLQMGVEEDIFLGWIERGFLKPVIVYNGQPYLKEREVERFLAEYMFDYEAQKLLGFTRQRFAGYLRRGKLKPLAGPELDGCPRYLFLRKKVERLVLRLEKKKN